MLQPRRKIATAHVADAQVDDPGWRHAKHNALREVGVLGNDGQVVLLRVSPRLGARAEIKRVRDGQAGLQGCNVRQVLVEEKAPHATRSREYWLPISRAA
jgi:hypothetical protein